MNVKYNFTVNDFEGPLDLLLHLIKESKMDIYEVSIGEITEQYIKYIHEQKELNIDIASEYLIMQAELIHLKSKKLLNIDEKEEQEEETLTEEDLRKRLIEYQRYKDITQDFKVLEDKRKEVLTKLPESLKEYKEDVKLNTDTTLENLLDAFKAFMERQKFQKPLNTKVTKKELSITKRCSEIRHLLETSKKVSFFDLFDIIDKPYLVVTFLSILEMTKNNEINIKQDANFENIIIEKK